MTGTDDMRYGRDLGCRFGQPHNMMIVYENPRIKCEKCLICHKKYRWNKGYKARVDNIAYLKAHVRQFCQRSGATKRIYHKLYKPKDTIITI